MVKEVSYMAVPGLLPLERRRMFLPASMKDRLMGLHALQNLIYDCYRNWHKDWMPSSELRHYLFKDSPRAVLRLPTLDMKVMRIRGFPNHCYRWEDVSEYIIEESENGSRRSGATTLRRVFFTIGRDMGYSFSEMADFMGLKSHASVMNAVSGKKSQGGGGHESWITHAGYKEFYDICVNAINVPDLPERA